MKILLVVYDNDSYISVFPLGLAYIASVCRKAGHDVKIYNQDVYHWPESHLLDLLNRERFDVVGVGVIGGYYQYRKLLKISAAINESKNRPFYILGGHGPSPEPEYFLKKTYADTAVIGEGEITIVELLEALERKKELSSISGIAFLENGKCIQTPRRTTIPDIDNIPFPAWDLFPMDHYALLREANIKNSERCMLVLSGRGCAFGCNFCYRMDDGHRPRSSEGIIEEIRFLQKDYAISYIDFQDELLMSSVSRTIALCESFIKSKLKFKWFCNGRLNYAKPEVLKVMKEAGCVFINYGIESLDEKALRVMKKGLTVKQIISGIENTLAAGISPGYNIIFGNIGETAESLRLGVEFLLKYDDHAQMRTIRPVTPYPGSPLYYYAIQKGLLKDCEDFYENKHRNSDLLTVNFTNLSDDEFHKSLFDANKILLESYYKHAFENTIKRMEPLYLEKDATFRGFRQT
ncbi:MAG: B12-binding domain-containing radical SAM protein [Candidatus Kuenenia stuttgartiensis]|uniref:B12-binding domain-containing radical SAM protein n=1 Tax=Kuenenia stuttgartiensis TaxID=174633 RepID=UPI00146BFE29|nr:radical SAM protein [Candidatus Kuenenia stuttgartiensis]GJQ50995.1 MAG: B12-binding domain-containing radical SAM protein [Candidatus Kuenenia stuttgartiensis]